MSALVWRHGQPRDRAQHLAGRAGQLLGVLLVGAGVMEAVVSSWSGAWTVLIGGFVFVAATGDTRTRPTSEVEHRRRDDDELARHG